MDYYHQHQKPKMCTQHNQPIVVVNSDPKIGQSCLVCVQNWPGNISIEQFNQQQQAVYDKLFKKMDLEHQQFQQQLDRLLKYKERIISSLDKIIQLIIDQIKMVKDSKLKISSIIQSESNKEQMIKDIQEVGHKQQLINKELQRLRNHTKDVNCLQFMKNSNSFVSGSDDSTIIIWIPYQNNKWIAQQF